MTKKPPRLQGGHRAILVGLAIVVVGTGSALFAYGAVMRVLGPSYYAQGYATSSIAQRFKPKLDKEDYDKRVLVLAHGTTTLPASSASSTASSTPPLWPPQTVYPNGGAILPFYRVVAYYGNFYSRQMGILGELDESDVLAKLQTEVDKWNAADPSTPVMPAIEYIDVTAQAAPGKDGKYRLRMPDDQIDKALEMAAKVHGIVILDVQVGLSTLQEELPLLDRYFALPNVHLAIDPEFSMKGGHPPGTVIGTFNAADINYAAQYLADTVRAHDLPPKILIVHRFTQAMVSNYKAITPLPEVQIVMVMDGWGPTWKKLDTYNAFIYAEPVQFTGVKIFYKNDLKPPSSGLWTPQDVLKLKPRPIYIQYQ